MTGPRILIVEDDINLGLLMKEYLESENFNVSLYRDGEAGLSGFAGGQFDLCILDIMLPKMDGFTLAEKIRQLSISIPIIILSARSMKEDKLKGFRIGIDDYITKPFDEEELVCRIQAILNRASVKSAEIKPDSVKIGTYTFERNNLLLCRGKLTRRLTVKESRILWVLARSANRLVKRDEIMNEVWGDDGYYTGRSLDVFISKLRTYLKKDPSVKIITIPTEGYVLETDQ
ncbi:MAG: response regulator transcription factor [Bacteroidales bacterium]